MLVLKLRHLLEVLDIDVFIKYDITYSESPSDNNIPVEWAFIGDTKNLQDVSKDCENYKDNTCRFEYEFDWNLGDSTIVTIDGYIQTGAINITLYDSTNNRKLATSVPIYDATGNYIISLDTTFDIFGIKNGTSLKITSYYSTEYSFTDVVSLFQIWGTFEPHQMTNEDFEIIFYH